MKIRSLLLVACIVVVPLIAMFSHRLPPGTRAAVGAFLRDIAAGRRAEPSRIDAAAAVPMPARDIAAAPHGSSATDPPAPPVAAPPIVAVAAAVPPPAGLDRLRELGAVAIDCRPLPGRGFHLASCRLPVDESGQLERVFQATGSDAEAAADNLLRDVTAWRRGATVSRGRTMRF